jgi:hypothetical protein
MSVIENNRAALLILSQQLSQLTYGDIQRNGLVHHPAHIGWDAFITNFELILDTITSLTHDSFSATVKKTMLVSQFRGLLRETLLRHREEWTELNYEQFVAFVGDVVTKGIIEEVCS